MAEIVLALGTSHSPLLSTPLELWSTFTEKDRNDPRIGDFEKLSREKASWIGKEITPEKWQERHQAVQSAIARLGETLARVAPDVVVTVGDDQREVFSADHMPALNIYWGDSATSHRRDTSKMPAWRKASLWGDSVEETTVFPCEGGLGKHIIESLVAQEFDVSHTQKLPENKGLGHAFTFICRRIMNGRLIPQVPIMLNTYYPPNQPTLKRCYALGKALRRAITTWESSKRVAIIASGGLTHFVVDEELDRSMLKYMQKKDEKKLTGFPEHLFVHGTSEIRNWVVIAGAMEEDSRPMEIVDYIPCYRSTAGSGVGSAFAQWV